MFSYKIVNVDGEVLLEDTTIYRFDEPFGKGILISDSRKSKEGYPVYDVSEIATISLDINGLWGMPSYGTPFIWPGGKKDKLGQFKNEPIYEVIEWSEDIPYELVKLEEESLEEE